jgi:hypothetical protein
MSMQVRHFLGLGIGFATFIAVVTGTKYVSGQLQKTPTTQQYQHLQNNQITKNHLAQQPSTTPYQVIDEAKNPKYLINPSQIFSSAKLPSTKVNFNQVDLLSVLENTRKYYQDYSGADPDISRNGILESQGVTVKDILNTLDFMIVVLQEDIGNKKPTRLQDPNFINQNFRVIKWTANNPQKPNQSKIRITKYAVFKHAGSVKKTAQYNIPIYSLKDNNLQNKFYTKYTKQDVLSGIYEPGGKEYGKVDTLAYLTREGLEEALLEGTVLINFADGKQGYYNVDRSNEIPYIKKLAPRNQKRYWYFRKVDAIKGYGYKIDAKISIKPGVTFAGDVLNIGLGRIVVIEYNQSGRKTLRMGTIGDTGGAFLPSLYQLDFLAGVFADKNEFGNKIQNLPEYATAYILVKK